MKCNHPDAKYFCSCPLVFLEKVDELHTFPDSCMTCEYFLVENKKKKYKEFVIVSSFDDEHNQQQPVIFNTEQEAARYIAKKYDLLAEEEHQIFETGYALIEPNGVGDENDGWILSDMHDTSVKPWFEFEITSTYDDRRHIPQSVIEVYYKDLSLEVQSILLKMFRVDTPNAMNWNVFPVFTIEAPNEEEEEKE